MKLATADDVLARMNLVGTVGASNTTAVDSALEGATSLIESILRTPLSQTDRIDTFSYSRSRYDLFAPFNLWLTQRFIEGTIEIRQSEDGSPVTSFAAADLVETTEYIYDPYNGLVTILTEVNQGRSNIAVRYSAGFKEGSSDIPGWLSEAAISAAVTMQHTQSVAHGKKDQDKVSPQMSKLLYSQLNEYILTTFGGFQPDRTTEL